MTKEIPLEKILPPSRNPRRRRSDAKIAELKASMREHGFISSLLVKEVDGGKMEVVTGAGRWLAANAVVEELREEIAELTDSSPAIAAELEVALGRLRKIPCIIAKGKQLEEAEEIQLIENLLREDLSEVDEAEGYRELIERKSYTVDGLAERICKSRHHIYERMRLCEAPKMILEALDSGVIPIKTALAIARIPSAKDREQCADEVLHPKFYTEPLSTTMTEEHIRQNYVNSLRNAGFDTEDGNLVPSAGPCESCQWKAANAADVVVASGLAGGRGIAPDACLNPGCFRAKSEAAWKIIQRQAEESGQALLAPDVALRVFSGADGKIAFDSPYVDLDTKPTPKETGHYDGEKVPRWRELVKGLNVPVTLARHPTAGKIHELVRRDLALTAIKRKSAETGQQTPFESGAGAAAKPGKAKEAEKAAEKKKDQLREAIEQLSGLATAIREEYAGPGLSRDFWVELAMNAYAANYESARLVRKWLGLADDEAAVQTYLASCEQTGEVISVLGVLLVGDEVLAGRETVRTDALAASVGLKGS